MKAKKHLGQNFLKCSWVSEKMISSAGLGQGDVVLEIGPGKGALTLKLLQAGAKVVAVEKDKELLPILQEKFQAEIKSGRLTLIAKDIRDIDEQFLKSLGAYKLIANIPYYITGELLRRFLESDFKPERIILLVQKEVAERIVSEKESVLSLSVKYFGEPKKLANVSKKCFAPVPKVDSAILLVDVSQHRSLVSDSEAFFDLLHLAFASKRKKLINNLAVNYDKSKLQNIFAHLGLSTELRPENLSVDDYVVLLGSLKKL